MQVGKINTEEGALKKKKKKKIPHLLNYERFFSVALFVFHENRDITTTKKKILSGAGREFRVKLVSKNTQKLFQP